ncbi:MAG: hypothetical protein A2603_09490 [Bdellovibrionales bacterium RIFOXYD1_FULL_55_31]|nr:MAG: hypothetical protein A2603_09490 [Bdellovibrionales bacterium RIFOXYD1_FULL_55_31]
MDQFAAALGLEAALVARERGPAPPYRLNTVYVGGGTPTLLEPHALASALSPILSEARLEPDFEWTIEANPSSVDKAKLLAYRKLGINRVSLGIQSLAPELLARLGRIHTREIAIRALDDIFRAGFENVSVDFLCGVPGQSISTLEESIQEAQRFPIKHLSCYLLTLPPDHSMYQELPDEEEQLEHLLWVDHFLGNAGFEHYEISNFAKPGWKSRHNMNYWNGLSYLALGPSAHSFDSEKFIRSKNVSSLSGYCETLRSGRRPIEWSEELTPTQREIEKWLLALRLSEGIAEECFNTPQRRRMLDVFERQGLVVSHPVLAGRKRLTPKGFALSDQIIPSFI